MIDINQETTDLLNVISGANTQKPEGLPDKFWDVDNNEVRFEALIKSYLELERKMSSSAVSSDVLLPVANIPNTPDEYEINVKDNLFEPDADMHARLHAKGFTCEQVQEVYDLAVEKMIPMIMDVAAQFHADREIERLRDNFGGDEQWSEMARQILSYGQKNLSPQVLKAMASSYEGVMALYSMMQSDEPQTLGAKSGAIASGKGVDLQSMMNDPKYWRDKDPAFIAKVTEGFKNMYAE